MDIESIVNKTARDLKMAGLIGEDWVEHVKYHIYLACIAAQEIKIKEVQRHHERKIISYRNGKEHGEHRSIREAAKACGYGKRYRGGELLVLNVLSGRHPHTKEGFTFEYADNGKGDRDKKDYAQRQKIPLEGSGDDDDNESQGVERI